jgi:predicted DNA-binding transcriptional regulator AlpA
MREAAKKLGLSVAALSRYVSSGKVPAPQIIKVGNFQVHSWTEDDVERVRQLLPKIENGRKTWRQKKQSAKKQLAISNQQSAKSKSKAKKPQPKATAPHKAK